MAVVDSLAQPFVQMFADELVVVQMWVAPAHAVKPPRLAGRQRLRRVQAPGAFEQALTAQDFVDARDAAGEAVRRIEQRRVGVGDLRGPREQ